jgi:hypothetical protein
MARPGSNNISLINNEEISRLAVFIKLNCKRNTLNPLLLPINEIDGIPVQVIFTCEGSHTNIHDISYLACSIYLEPNIEYTMAEYTVRGFGANFTLEHGILLLLEKLNTLSFNKFNGLIETKTVITPDTDGESASGYGQADVMRDLYNIIKAFKNLTPTVIECCVCYGVTKTHTNCNHRLCIACYSQLAVVKEGWCEYSGKPTYMKNCPLCRGLITKLLPETHLGELDESLIPESDD